MNKYYYVNKENPNSIINKPCKDLDNALDACLLIIRKVLDIKVISPFCT